MHFPYFKFVVRVHAHLNIQESLFNTYSVAVVTK